MPAGQRTPIALSIPATPGYTVADALQLESASAPSPIDDLHPDHLGTVRAITDTSQTVIWRWDSAPFGDTLPNEDPDGDGQALRFNLRFPGQYFDVETGLHYNYFRDYDPTTGRYVQSDPIGLVGGINTFAYVDGNPLSYLDPDGLFGRRPNLPDPFKKSDASKCVKAINRDINSGKCIDTTTCIICCAEITQVASASHPLLIACVAFCEARTKKNCEQASCSIDSGKS